MPADARGILRCVLFLWQIGSLVCLSLFVLLDRVGFSLEVPKAYVCFRSAAVEGQSIMEASQ